MQDEQREHRRTNGSFAEFMNLPQSQSAERRSLSGNLIADGNHKSYGAAESAVVFRPVTSRIH
jgi:hypothetical protein